jgi:hypothetical protein
MRKISVMKDTRYRGKKVKYFTTTGLRAPTKAEMRTLSYIDHQWTSEDRYFALAHRYYADSSAWRVIAWYNQFPLEVDIPQGAIIRIPFPLEEAVALMRG